MTTGGQSQVTGGGGRDDDQDDFSQPTGGSGTEQLHVTGTDDLLDEIDGLLENNAEEFVRSYVQKGGQ
ncbi:ubiquitin-like protein Pup [Corynebacterium falsenii]|uniref:ubiquitin-like protein Pup n=1 Tax=Corynebacterium falsenii TaxID=108486 RepID=UPI0003E96ABC|nr:ubiquitin-like protein Pup [Corynebacterium falsenii]AHI03093.1 ubiquitin [Corynebacterium falsenii DSM 44353]MDC7104530.1 ubiquitin-like protein Pup [Corynebacterium falsenii]UBI03801.1 ubiquitin-like protein Pup [Corynebacterium falsenii]HJF12171.1 ubiquitin-like protein Pup [Corynebacterium falsenii]